MAGPAHGAAAPPERTANVRDARPASFLQNLFVPLALLGLGGPAAQEPALDRDLGEILDEVQFEVSEPVVALYLDVRGKVRFERAEVTFADGTRTPIELFGRLRSNGLYELARFDGERRVARVRLAARAERGRAHVGLRLGV